MNPPKFTQAKRTHYGDITARSVRDWLNSLPEEFLDSPFGTTPGTIPFSLKRLVAYRHQPTGDPGVTANPMGSHLPFDKEFHVEHVLH